MDLAGEQEELKQLYAQAAAELRGTGEKLTIWAGGDAPNQQDALAAQFSKRFPNVPIAITVDLSKYHNIKIYQELLDGYLTPDVAMLQTMNDFENWKAMGVLENFTPKSFPSLIPGWSDSTGAYFAMFVFCFVPQYSKNCVRDVPRGYTDFLKPEYRNRLVLTPPHDDDAVLFVYDKILKQYGEEFLRRLAAQNPCFVRGTAAPAILAGRKGFLGNLTGYITAPDDPAASFIPESDFFVSWPQRAAMFKLTRHKAAARLFLAYMLSYEYQSARGTWPVRRDVAPPAGSRPLETYKNTSPQEFIDWMRDRKHLHDLRARMEKLFGPVCGPSPLCDPDLLRLYRRYT